MPDNVVQMPPRDFVKDMLGPKRTGHSVIIDGHVIPNLAAYEEGERIVFVLDERLAFEFDRDQAHYAASFAAEAMAVGAGFPSMRGARLNTFTATALPLGAAE